MKNDGSIITTEMDKQNDVEPHCKKVFVDKPSFGVDLVSKICNIILNANDLLSISDFLAGAKDQSAQKSNSGMKTRKSLQH